MWILVRVEHRFAQISQILKTGECGFLG